MAQNNTIGARDIMESEALSGTAVLDFLWPYQTIKSLSNSIITAMGGIFKSGWANVMVKFILWLMFMFLLWVPLNVYFRFVSFWIASGYRIIMGVGGRDGRNVSFWYFGCYTFIFAFFYVPYVIPWTFRYISWEEIFQWLKIL